MTGGCVGNALGIDVSRYNGLVNWQNAAAQGIRFAGIRVCISWAYRDPFGAANLSGAADAGIHRIAYHVLYPGESARRQADNYLATTAGADCWPALDLELDHGQTPAHITDTTLDWCNIVESSTGMRPILYSRAGWVNEHMTAGSWRNDYHWWLASYNANRTTERPAPPVLPSGVHTWLIHQNSDKIPAPAGLQSGGIMTCDVNRWNGDDAAVDAWFGGGTTWEQSIDAWARTLGYTGRGPDD